MWTFFSPNQAEPSAYVCVCVRVVFMENCVFFRFRLFPSIEQPTQSHNVHSHPLTHTHTYNYSTDIVFNADDDAARCSRLKSSIRYFISCHFGWFNIWCSKWLIPRALVLCVNSSIQTCYLKINHSSRAKTAAANVWEGWVTGHENKRDKQENADIANGIAGHYHVTINSTQWNDEHKTRRAVAQSNFGRSKFFVCFPRNVLSGEDSIRLEIWCLLLVDQVEWHCACWLLHLP